MILSWIYCTLFDFRYVGTICKALDVLERFPCPQSERQRSENLKRYFFKSPKKDIKNTFLFLFQKITSIQTKIL